MITVITSASSGEAMLQNLEAWGRASSFSMTVPSKRPAPFVVLVEHETRMENQCVCLAKKVT